jgi:hypothetical protein
MRVMFQPMMRRDAIWSLTTAPGVVLAGGRAAGQDGAITIGGVPVEVAVSSLSPVTVRLRVPPLAGNVAATVPVHGALVQSDAPRVGAGRVPDTFKAPTARRSSTRTTGGALRTAKGSSCASLSPGATPPGV